ncbi:MAG: hypothetical protein VST70_09270 [Nitrospirota bacterium]|nr:hypothetical protein [Nitrospirota bacterium]
MTNHITLPPEMAITRQAAIKALGPIKPANNNTSSDFEYLNAKRTNAGRNLPAYYLVYFLLVDLLNYKNLGQWEKVAWSVPIDFYGKTFLIEHRKMGVGVFVPDAEKEEDSAYQIVGYIQKGVKAARPFFDWLATQAVQKSLVNIENRSDSLFERYQFFLNLYKSKEKEAVERKNEKIIQEKESPHGYSTSVFFPVWKIKTESHWLALATIDAFFSWTEHIFIHMAILSGKLKSANEVAELANAEWQVKFKTALSLSEKETKIFFDKLMIIRKEVRNFVSHGAFGKQGEAFSFHSGAGAVPVLLPHHLRSRKFRFGDSVDFDNSLALSVVEEFIKHLWSGERAPSEIYIQSGLPLIFTMALDGTYARAMTSIEEMSIFVDHLTHEVDRSANMDW